MVDEGKLQWVCKHRACNKFKLKAEQNRTPEAPNLNNNELTPAQPGPDGGVGKRRQEAKPLLNSPDLLQCSVGNQALDELLFVARPWCVA